MFVTTNEAVTSRNTYDHYPMAFIVREDFKVAWTNAIASVNGVTSWTIEENYKAGEVIRGESWRPEGIIMCRRANADGYPIEGAKEMFLQWHHLAHCDLAKEVA